MPKSAETVLGGGYYPLLPLWKEPYVIAFFLTVLVHLLVQTGAPAPASTLGPAGQPAVQAADSLGPAG